MPTDDLFPCPFCGGEPRVMHCGAATYMIQCVGCKVTTDDGGLNRIADLWNRRGPSPETNVAAGISLTLTRALGMYGAAYDPIGVPLRAYTYEHQPGNGVAWNLGCAVSALRRHSSGDAIDVGLYLLKEMQARGLGVFEIEPKAVEPAPAQHDGPGYLDLITPDEIFDQGPAAVKNWQEAKRAELQGRSPEANLGAALGALRCAEQFMAGFEGDKMQTGIDADLRAIRDAIASLSSQIGG